ncbi:MAG: 16S rRNA (cytosine(1402)-N(4))-methyltransferase RsmH [Deltaproteobacteria bacterium]|nr:MAG: 16S rRNA (cytosine(1402)-N(4))-methyltransferase RsmH [Deltaproteobacteria bacterium]
MLATAAPRAVFQHETVLRDEVLALLGPALGEGRIAVDCTAGGGGHTEALLSTGATVVAIDKDPAALAALEERLGGCPRLRVVPGDFREVEALLEAHHLGPVDALLADLGVSSPQLDTPARGFSFRHPGPLDMRMDPTRGVPLSERLASVDLPELTRILRDYGEERRARRIARALIEARDAGRLGDTADLARVVEAAAGPAAGRLHPATRTFQALRIWVNDELGALEALLDALPRLLAPGGRAAIVSFHSLEDRRVKQRFRALAQGRVHPPGVPVRQTEEGAPFEILTPRACVPSEAERRRNPRARSARLRAIRRVGAPGEGGAQ